MELCNFLKQYEINTLRTTSVEPLNHGPMVIKMLSTVTSLNISMEN